ncbi:MAG: hypothetical protein WC214_08705 [Candidatus Omnitrophota bacterium]
MPCQPAHRVISQLECATFKEPYHAAQENKDARRGVSARPWEIFEVAVDADSKSSHAWVRPSRPRHRKTIVWPHEPQLWRKACQMRGMLRVKERPDTQIRF